MSASPDTPEIFDRRRRARQRDRAVARFADYDFLYRHMADELLDRLASVSRALPEALVVGSPDSYLLDALRAQGRGVWTLDPGFYNARATAGVQADEDAFPFADDSFDLILACGTLDSVNDLPGALILMNRALRPDGLLLAAFAGAGSLPMLRAALMAGESERPGQHVHPQIDVRSAGDLMGRAGYALPVADGDTLTVRYRSLFRLMSDLRGMGAGNALASRPPSLLRQTLSTAASHFTKDAEEDGKTAERFGLIFLSGWKPDASQPKPARRGSATVSLAEALKPKAS